MNIETAELKPLQARARNMLGYALYRLGQHSAAIEVFDMALQDADDNAERRGQILGDRSLTLAALGHHEEAVAEAGRALELAPGSATLHHTLGFVLYFAGRPSDAIPLIEKALELDPAFGAATQHAGAGQGGGGPRPTRPSTSSRKSSAATHWTRTPSSSFRTCMSSWGNSTRPPSSSSLI